MCRCLIASHALTWHDHSLVMKSFKRWDGIEIAYQEWGEPSLSVVDFLAVEQEAD